MRLGFEGALKIFIQYIVALCLLQGSQFFFELADYIRRARVGLSNKNRPLGSFLFLGPSGVGKTETAKVIADKVFDDPNALIRIDMSEFGESFNVSKLIKTHTDYCI